MGFKVCMNSSCGLSRTTEWKKGWPLRSGGYADLCFRCGSAYESSVFCDTFHSEESGWRECCICSKRLHCGCIASSSQLQLLEYGGVGCASCTKSSGLHSVRKFGTHGDEIANGFGALSISNGRCCAVDSRLSEKNQRGEDFVDICSMLYTQKRDLIHNLLTQPVKSVRKEMGEEIMHANGEMGATFQNVTQPHVGAALFTKTDNARPLLDVMDMNDPLSQPSLSMTLGEQPGKVKFVLPYTNGVAVGRDQSGTSPPFQQEQLSRDRPIVPKLPKNGQTLSSETNKTVASQARVARPPAEGRGKNHLLPRYWPRITDQELQQLSGDLKSTIVPLFEKILSASDAGRIGRLVLPKACAEAYFPPISQSEGLPLRIQDVKGNEWTFQFRFWPNNNSRMYVLEGVTPCIQTMQLRAGDTVIFSRIDPGGKLVMGFRKAINSDTQDTETSALNNGIPSAVPSNTSFTENEPSAGTNSGLHHLPKENKDPHLDTLSENISLPDGDVRENYGNRGNGESMQQQVVNSEKKRTRNIGKNKRLLIYNEDASELRLTWEEAQYLLRPPPSVKPTVVTIEDHEFEEYDEPPVFGKRTIYTACSSGGEEQWVQCDDCSKWRRLPGNVLLLPKWTCVDNVWDSSRYSCSAAAEISPKELENLLRVHRDLKKRRVLEARKLAHEPSGLDALASAAALGEKLGESGESSVGATTKHPRHRPGCSCIVCIQPPSGKGKHKPTCTCNVCMTVKRRFKTLMLRKKRRQSEREAELAELARKESDGNKDAVEIIGARNGYSENEGSEGRTQAEVAEISSGHIDLNCHPIREDMHVEEIGVSMISSCLVEAVSMPLTDHIKHNGEVDGYREQKDAQHPELFSQSTHQETQISDEEFLASVGWEQKTAED